MTPLQTATAPSWVPKSVRKRTVGMVADALYSTRSRGERAHPAATRTETSRTVLIARALEGRGEQHQQHAVPRHSIVPDHEVKVMHAADRRERDSGLNRRRVLSRLRRNRRWHAEEHAVRRICPHLDR